MKTILIIEDEPHIARFIKKVLEDEAWVVYTAETGQRGLIEAATRRPDLIILDLGLPDSDGLEIINDIRTWSKLPIIVLSARSNEQDKIQALNYGADDYLTKPFSMGELLARVNALLRRYQNNQDSDAIVQMGDIYIDTSQREVSKNGEVVHLTPIEYKLLCLLARNVGRVLTHTFIMQNIWGNNSADDITSLRVFMATLRKKINSSKDAPQYIQTHVGVGYRMVKVEYAT